MTKYVYNFNEGKSDMRNLLGGKGANLCEMTNLGMPVPRGFVITTEACTRYYDDEKQIAAEIKKEIEDHIATLEKQTGKQLGSVENPLLVSVRSGARTSMPGMMDTILNLGLNDEVVEGLAKLTDNPRFAYDSYRRFITMFSDVAIGIDRQLFEAEIDKIKEKKNIETDHEMDTEDMKFLVKTYKEIYERERKEPFPQDPQVQLFHAIEAVFGSWNNERAIYYRRMNNIPGSWGTAVNVQEMVYGNMGESSGTGVAFSRNPATGEDKVYGEYLMNAQGEDVVAGIRTPFPMDHMAEQFPDLYKQFVDAAKNLEKHYGDMQDMEFTIENGKLFFLQTRNGKRTATAAVKVAVDMVESGLVSKEKALMQIDPNSLNALLHPSFDTKALAAETPITKGLPASPGAASGQVVFTAADARAWHEAGKEVILVRLETSPEDIEGMNLAQGILTVRGGMTSHAAVVARGMGKCCICGCSEVSIDAKAKTFTVNGHTVKEGDEISLDGTTGTVYLGKVKMAPAEMSENFKKIMAYADEVRVMNVRANADTPQDATNARNLGAGGIGLVRTEHMFFSKDRIFAFRKMILAKTAEEREKALATILPIQQNDFEGIFEAMADLPVTIRLLDPPLHEFLPKQETEIKELADAAGLPVSAIHQVIEELAELNPMLGMRGCRLAIYHPEIPRMQTAAIIRAALAVQKKGIKVYPEIMVPLVATYKELDYLRKIITEEADRIIAEEKGDLKYLVGTMIEIPRAALTADEVARYADFFSFGTNDLTQMGYGLSRDDAGAILDTYYKEGIFETDPTAHLDIAGVGQLVQMGAEKGRKTNPEVHLGICGEHGGDPSSIEFCHQQNFDYVSCSPFRVPIAKLAAAQAQIKNARPEQSHDLVHALKYLK